MQQRLRYTCVQRTLAEAAVFGGGRGGGLHGGGGGHHQEAWSRPPCSPDSGMCAPPRNWVKQSIQHFTSKKLGSRKWREATERLFRHFAALLTSHVRSVNSASEAGKGEEGASTEGA